MVPGGLETERMSDGVASTAVADQWKLIQIYNCPIDRQEKIQCEG